MPLVTTDDGSLCFLIDTGASYNVLMEEAYVRAEKGQFTTPGRIDYLIGMNGSPQKIFMVEGSFRLGGEDFRARFGVLQTTEAMHTVQVISGRRIDGALGVDFLTEYGLIIDMHNLCLRTAEQSDSDHSASSPDTDIK